MFSLRKNTHRKYTPPAFERTLIHEVEHLTEGTEEWETLAHYLIGTVNNDPAFEAVARNYFKGDETVGESALAKFKEGIAFTELTEQEQLFLTELIAHETEVLFGSERMLKRLAKEKRSLAKRLLERIEDFFRILKMNKEERKAFVKLETARGYLEKALWAAGDREVEGQALFAKNDGALDDEDLSVKKQIKNHIAQIENSEIVASISYSSMNKKELKEEVLKAFKSLGYAVDRQNFGRIEIGEKEINEGLNYVQTEGEKAAMFLLPKVLKRGVDISEHSDHKGRGHSTKTFAAKVEINGVIGIVGVVVKQTSKNKYHAHRILAVDGSKYLLETKKDVKSTSAGMPAQKSKEGPAIDSTSTNSIHQNGDSVKPDAKKSKADEKFESFSSDSFWSKNPRISVESTTEEKLKRALQEKEMWKKAHLREQEKNKKLKAQQKEKIDAVKEKEREERRGQEVRFKEQNQLRSAVEQLRDVAKSVISYSPFNCPKDNITMRSIISLRSNITRR